MSVFSKRNLLVGMATLVIGVGASAAIWGVPGFMRRSTSVKSQVTAYLLNDRGEVNGLLLASGDQLHFSSQTGAVVGSQIKVGDEVTASGHAGSKTSYGREVRVEQISANGRTIVEAKAGPPRHEPHEKRGPRDRSDRGTDPREKVEAPAQGGPQTPPVAAVVAPTEAGRGSTNDPSATQTANAQQLPPSTALPTAQPAPELFKAAGTIRTHLVNGHGDVDGLILSSGELVRFSPKVGQLIVAAELGATTLVSVEGNGVRNEHGTVIRPTQFTVGNQTIALAR